MEEGVNDGVDCLRVPVEPVSQVKEGKGRRDEGRREEQSRGEQEEEKREEQSTGEKEEEKREEQSRMK